ncbi:sirohydrochlorin chelatase [Microbacterium rhizosphaerae]|uniref:CbiX/SirB N-terminal domain-containing protein n=1 Tax=Microbacterium rhizosphaerae TaxID=1678237 RepID=A0ABZ0SNQ6_9MICO|nr:CbiX/SirB N-terminal domain-containing protein [Microbacterium rhizosphaerae]WPR90120.1 CbiX/SirB N-terminal domain-containing protein [Microbacterium rhizosphaerae]
MPHPALLAISHGTASAEGQASIQALVDAVGRRLPQARVRLGHVDVQQPDVAASLAELSDGPVVIVPLLLSAGYHVRIDLREQSAHRDDVTITPALGPDPRLADLLAERLREIEPNPGHVVLAVAGSSDERANDDCRLVARMLGDTLGREVHVGFLAAAEPRLGAAVDAAIADSPDTVVANYLLAPGYFHDLATREAHGRPLARPLLTPDSEPAASLVDIVVERYLDAAQLSE